MNIEQLIREYLQGLLDSDDSYYIYFHVNDPEFVTIDSCINIREMSKFIADRIEA